METHFLFYSDQFAATAGEQDESHEDFINPGLFAKELADFLETRLAKHGYKIKFKCAEDWGQWLEIEHTGKFTLAVCCANSGDEKDHLIEHRVFITPATPHIRKFFRKIDISATIETLGSTLRQILEDEKTISDITVEEE